jgi:hypothetical protein
MMSLLFLRAFVQLLHEPRRRGRVLTHTLRHLFFFFAFFYPFLCRTLDSKLHSFERKKNNNNNNKERDSSYYFSRERERERESLRGRVGRYKKVPRIMGVITDQPEYPVTDKHPSISKCIANFNTQDWATAIAFPIASYPFGMWAGAKTINTSSYCLKKPTAITAMICGGMCGMFLAVENSAGRLMGFRK